MEDSNVGKALRLNEEDAASAGSPLSTPDQKLGFNRPKDGSESSSSTLSSDSDSESFNSSGNAYFSIPPASADNKGMRYNSREDNSLTAEENDELLKKVVEYEEELQASKMSQQLLEIEVTRLKSELEKSNTVAELSGTLQVQLESANREIQMRDADHQLGRMKLALAQEEIAVLKAKLDSESRRIFSLEETTAILKNDLLRRDEEVEALRLEVIDAVEKFSTEKLGLQGVMDRLSEKHNALEEKQYRYEAERKKLEDEISQLKAEVVEKCGEVERLNKSHDGLKLKHDMLVAEKDEFIAKVNKLVADVCSRDEHIKQLEAHQQQLETEQLELKSRSGNAERQVDELKTNVAELEMELTEGAEAIRQLCFCLEHYRSGYEELRRAVIGRKRHIVLAA